MKKVTLLKFRAKEIKKADVTRLRNLLVKLKVEFECIDATRIPKDFSTDLIYCDESQNIDFKKLKDLI